MKILIIGSKGFIGSYAYQYFAKLPDYVCWGCDVVADYVDSNYLLIDSANSDFNEVFENLSFDVCVNCSGAASVTDSLIHPLRDFNLNVHNVVKILEAIRRHAKNCKFINLSSAAVYGNPNELPISVSTKLLPVSPYGKHKMYAEMLCEEYFQFFGIQTLSMRIFSAYGPGLKKQLFWDWYRKSLVSDIIEVFGTGDESRDFIYINDLIQVIHQAITNAEFCGNAINVANGQEIFIKDIAQIFFENLNKPFLFSGEMRIGNPINWVADTQTIKSWGYQPKIDLETGIKKFIEWAKESN